MYWTNVVAANLAKVVDQMEVEVNPGQPQPGGLWQAANVTMTKTKTTVVIERRFYTICTVQNFME